MIDWQVLLSAVALALVLEGVLPFLTPQSLRRSLKAIEQLSDAQLRGMGVISMVLGLVLLYFVKLLN